MLAEHGADARIVAAERVTVGGIRGFFARRHLEVTVEVPLRRRRAAHAQPDVQARLGIAALLDEADEAEARLQRVAEPRLSTASDEFAHLMDELTFTTTNPASDDPGRAALVVPAPAARAVAAPVAPPLPLTGHGDLVLVIGRSDAAFPVARAMAARSGSGSPLVAGVLTAARSERLTDRRTALAARARAVEHAETVFVAFGLAVDDGTGDGDGDARAAADADAAAILSEVGADQVWVVVDAGRKADDTAAWVSRLAAQVFIDAVAVIEAGSTASPETIDELGLPVGWIDGSAATSATMAGLKPSLTDRANRSS